MDEGLTHSLEGVAVDMGHIVIDGVPRRAEGTLGTVRIIGDDIDAGDLRHTIHGQMVVSDATTFTSREETAKAYDLRSTPHLIDDAAGIAKGELFLIELRTLTTNHIEKDAITGLVTIHVGISSPVLGTKGPSVTRVVGIFPLREAPVFGIEAEEVDSDFF